MMRKMFFVAVLLMSLAGNIDGINDMIKAKYEIRSKAKDEIEQYMIVNTFIEENYN